MKIKAQTWIDPGKLWSPASFLAWFSYPKSALLFFKEMFDEK
jgi:hypothetical protein